MNGEADIDRITKERRSRNMARIGAKNTGPELVVRRMLHQFGYRFRLHAPFLPGKPDVAFSRRRKVVLVHGCFWHRHTGCPRARLPASRVDFWTDKFARNVERDKRVEAALRDLGWTALVIWECETKQPETLGERLMEFLGPPNPDLRITSC